MHNLIYISEQHIQKPLEQLTPNVLSILEKQTYKRLFYDQSELVCFELFNDEDGCRINTSYFIGVDWLVPDRAAVYVEPKLNVDEQIDFMGMLLESFDAPENLDHLDGLFQIDFNSPWINIPEQKDRLSPILIVQFLKLVKRIVQKGLKKSYYRVTENLSSRIKGKILVGKQIKENVFKNRLTRTICNYQEFGVNNEENQFIKAVLDFVSSYLGQKHHLFSKEQLQLLNHILNYCFPAFEHVNTLSHMNTIIQGKKNAFYKEYDEAIKIGMYILKKFSFNINKNSQGVTSTPPFWINMSKLFELYVFGKLRSLFPETDGVTYHDNFKGGKQTDILIRVEGAKCVIDCKYKPQYRYEDPTLEDKRQLAGYTRLKSVYNRLEISHENLVKGLIIYPDQHCDEEILKEMLFERTIEEYVEFYKMGIKLPQISTSDSKMLEIVGM